MSDTKANWTSSNMRCMEIDPEAESKLTPINTKAESDYIFSKIGDETTWIGGYLDSDMERQGIWRYVRLIV